MNVLHINTHLTGGAAQAALAIHRELLRFGVDTNFLVQVRGGNTDLPHQRIYDTLEGTLSRGMLELKEVGYKVRRNYLLSKLPKSPIWYSFPWSPYDLIATEAYQKADIIHLHWVGEFLNYRSFFKKNKKPIVWTLHDLNPVTGGQHSEYGFPSEYKELSQKMAGFKQKTVQGQRIHWVCPSKLHQQRAEKFPLFGLFPSSNIPNGVDSNIFQPKKQALLREVLDLPQGKKIAFFIAYPDDYALKGMAVMREVMQAMEDENLLFLCIGNADVSAHTNCRSLGAVHDKLLLSQLYGAADLLISPSLEESFGLTIVESLSCGTPVVSFPTGIAPSIISQGQNGWLCPEKTTESMVSTLKKSLDNSLSKNSAAIAAENLKFDWKEIAKQYLDLYRQILH